MIHVRVEVERNIKTVAWLILLNIKQKWKLGLGRDYIVLSFRFNKKTGTSFAPYVLGQIKKPVL